jgi:hypothetical protein
MVPRSLVLLAGLASVAQAQPAEFYDLGSFTPSPTPAYNAEYVDGDSWFQPEQVVDVEWARIELLAGVGGDTYFDYSSWISNPGTPIVLALYDGSGALVAFNEGAGASNGAAGLSFGSTGERVPFDNENLRGQDGATLAAGTYWLAVVAGPLSSVTLGANWGVSTTESFVFGFDDTQTYVSQYGLVGNTTPVAPPVGDQCSAPILVGEDAGATPAWTGTSFGATQDGNASCYSPNPAGITAKDIWFQYIPTFTGWAVAEGAGVGGAGNTIILSRFDGGCGTPATRCVGSGSFDFGNGSRMSFQVTQGQPVLLSLAQRGGDWGEMRLNIDALPAPCFLNTPGGAIQESEASCGDFSNGGCQVGLQFDPIAPGQTVTGTLWNSLSARDTDWYEFTLTEAAIITLEAASQLATEVVLFEPEFTPGNCFGPQPIILRTPNFLAPCNVMTGTTIVEPGVHRIAIGQRFLDGFNCGSGYEGYWIRLSTQPCDQAQPTVQPAPAEGCLGGSVSFTADYSSPGPITYQWQIGVEVEGAPLGFLYWTDIFDGELGDVFSLAQVTGSDTTTLTISGLDEAAGLVKAVRLKATTCADNWTTPATFTLLPAGSPNCQSCDSIDFNNDTSLFDPTDIDAFLSVFSEGPCIPTGATCNDIDFNNDTSLFDPCDIDSFLLVFSEGPCTPCGL